ncbi:MAG: prepilin-type N-terminal cleavage/methylation domain-containing protein, partial [Candidatus Krumholzibacteria bacterium]|nr:prepilin-type N-terminal cleavage/methylation domain-containing protein [Candidatus Krumholzibacteria bacterium]
MEIKRNTDSRNTAVNARSGFTLVEMVISILVLGFVLISVAGIFALFQKGSVQSGEYSLAQQNARIAVDFITGDLRQAGAQTDYYRGQRPIVHAGPYQIAFNADLDNGETIDGNPPLTALSTAVSPNSVPLSGAPIYTPAADYDSDAETVVFTLDSTHDGIIGGADRGDDPEETPLNRNLFVLKKAVYGYAVSGGNEMRENDLALLRGPNLSPTWTIPEPLFQYYYDHDDDPATNDRLWGDGNGNGRLDDAEILAVAAMPQNLLGTIRKVRITAISESEKYDSKYETNGGFLGVTMNSEVFVRNMSTSSSTIRGKVYHDADSDGVMDTGETGLPAVEVRLAGQNRSVFTDNFGAFYFALPAGAYSIQEVDPPGYSSTTANLVSLNLASGQA